MLYLKTLFFSRARVWSASEYLVTLKRRYINLRNEHKAAEVACTWSIYGLPTLCSTDHFWPTCYFGMGSSASSHIMLSAWI